MNLARVNGLDLAYERAGEGPPLVFVHGGAEDGRIWQPQLAALADEFTVVAWDEPGAGRSSDVPEDFALADYANCLAAVIDDLALGPAHVAGISWGGTVVQELYRNHPRLVATLILTDTYAGWKGSLPEEDVRARVAGVRRMLTAPARIRMARHSEVAIHPERNPVLKLLSRVLPMTTGYHGDRLIVRERGRRLATPMMGALILVATFDVVFAVDSIPAIFAITRDTFIVYAANAFSLLGLGALYFVLAGMMGRFRYLNLGLAAVLVFVGLKMSLVDLYKVPAFASLAIIAALLTAAVGASLLRPAPLTEVEGAVPVEPSPARVQ